MTGSRLLMALVQFISGELFAVHALCINTSQSSRHDKRIRTPFQSLQTTMFWWRYRCALSKICFAIAPAKHPLKQIPQSQSTLHSRKGYIASNTSLSGKTCTIRCFEGCFEGVLWGVDLQSPGASGETSGGTVCGRVLS